ncbi:MAG: hypothetical protein L0H19_05490 [Salinisphaera sp.]|nr:hypothetical protein [Salinisphaera sp.]
MANRKTLATALGTAFVASSFAGIAAANTSPFQLEEVNAPSGYTLVASHDGEGSCGASKDQKKGDEGSCGANKKTDDEGNCGADKKKMDDEGNCGSSKG